MDLKQRSVAQMQLVNTNVRSIAWRGVTVTVNDRKTKQSKTIVDNVEGIVNAGECCALMGPLGSGKTTLLNVLARRPSKYRSIDGNILVNGSSVSQSAFRKISCFVEQQDALIRALTVFETLSFTSRLTTTSLRKGISDGQKRRLAVARQLVTSPKILFLDELTSRLDSSASFEVVQYLRATARRNNLIVICSVHQPSTPTINLFDKLLLVATGKPHYFGAVSNVYEHDRNIGVDIPQRVNPTNFLLELVNTDFAQHKAVTTRHNMTKHQESDAQHPH